MRPCVPIAEQGPSAANYQYALHKREQPVTAACLHGPDPYVDVYVARFPRFCGPRDIGKQAFTEALSRTSPAATASGN